MLRIFLAALVGVGVLVIPAIAAGDSSESPSSDARIVRQAEPNAVLSSQPREDSATPASVTDLKTTTAVKEDEPGGVSNDDVTGEGVGDVQASLNDSQDDIDDVDDKAVDDVDNGDVDDVDDKAVNDVDNGDVSDVDDKAVNDFDDEDVDNVDENDVDGVDDGDLDDEDAGDVDDEDDGNVEG